MSLPVVPVATFQGHCYASVMNVNDSFIDKSGAKHDIIGISRILRGTEVVGWIYRTNENAIYVQAMPNMPAAAQKKLGISPPIFDPHFSRPTPNSAVFRYSNITRVWNWPRLGELSEKSCTKQDH